MIENILLFWVFPSLITMLVLVKIRRVSFGNLESDSVSTIIMIGVFYPISIVVFVGFFILFHKNEFLIKERKWWWE